MSAKDQCLTCDPAALDTKPVPSLAFELHRVGSSVAAEGGMPYLHRTFGSDFELYLDCERGGGAVLFAYSARRDCGCQPRPGHFYLDAEAPIGCKQISAAAYPADAAGNK